MPATPLPLAGRRVVVTRATAQSQELLDRLRAAGAEAVALPTIALAPPSDAAPLDAALRAWSEFDGCIVTSANAVRALWGRAEALGLALAPPRAWVCAVGPATAAALREHAGWENARIPAQPTGAGVVAALAHCDLAGCRVLFPRADLARQEIPRALSARGAAVTSVEAYRTVVAEASRPAALAAFPGADGVVFASPSAALNLAALLGSDHAGRLRGTAITVIGPSTRAAVEALGWPVAAEAVRPDAEALTAAVRQALRHA